MPPSVDVGFKERLQVVHNLNIRKTFNRGLFLLGAIVVIVLLERHSRKEANKHPQQLDI